jgi:hypothetical protein
MLRLWLRATFNFISVPDGRPTLAASSLRRLKRAGDGIGESTTLTWPNDIEGLAGVRSCPIRPVCNGCLAITYSLGRDVFEERDPSAS